MKLIRRKAAAGDRRVVWQSASLLLAYPDDDFEQRLGVVRAAAAELPEPYAGLLLECAERLSSFDPLDRAARYVETFDWRRRRTLFLTYYTAGDTRNRGLAMLTFSDAYRRAGIAPPADELPDHLAVVLEFAATVDESAGYDLLCTHRTPIDMLLDGLRRAQSPYASVIEAVSATLPAATEHDLREARRLAMQGPPAESVGLEPFSLTPTIGSTDLGMTIPVREGAR